MTVLPHSVKICGFLLVKAQVGVEFIGRLTFRSSCLLVGKKNLLSQANAKYKRLFNHTIDITFWEYFNNLGAINTD